jgi:hypothetical protein
MFAMLPCTTPPRLFPPHGGTGRAEDEHSTLAQTMREGGIPEPDWPVLGALELEITLTPSLACQRFRADDDGGGAGAGRATAGAGAGGLSSSRLAGAVLAPLMNELVVPVPTALMYFANPVPRRRARKDAAAAAAGTPTLLRPQPLLRPPLSCVLSVSFICHFIGITSCALTLHPPPVP